MKTKEIKILEKILQFLGFKRKVALLTRTLNDETIVEVNHIKGEPDIQKFQYQTPLEYPIILTTKISTNPILEENESRLDKGVLEDFFFDYLKSVFTDKVFNSIKININGTFVTPDFVIIDNERKKNIIIEIDEPYTIDADRNLIPIHIKAMDDERNIRFLKNGWSVVRFAEEQIIKYPNECIKQIVDFMEKSQLNADFPHKIKCWLYDESKLMIDEKYRNSYLPSEFKDSGRTNLGFSYRRFVIKSCFLTESQKQEKYISIIFNLNINENNDTTLRYDDSCQCWITEEDFFKNLEKSRFCAVIEKYGLSIDDSYGILSMLKGWELKGIGKNNNKYFNLMSNNKFEIDCSDKILKEFDDFLNKICDETKNEEKNEEKNQGKVLRNRRKYR